MTVNRFVKNEPKATVSEPVSANRPTQCEISGCQSLYVGKNAQGKELFKAGKADVFVKDNRGDLRGICATHYTGELVRQGKAANQELVDEDGRMVLAKIQAVRESEKIPLVIQPPLHGAPKGPQQFTVHEVVARVLEQDDRVSDEEFFANHERDRGAV